MSGALDLFAGAAPRVRAISASAPFLDTLVAACARSLRTKDDPFALADALILLPNRRAARGLIDAFAKHFGGATLLPSIRPLADLEDDPDVWGHEPLALDVPPAIDPLRRRLELAALVRARDAASGGVDDPVRAMAFADALCRMLDAAAASGAVDWRALPTLADADLAEHWRASAQFLEIIAAYWPQRLAAEGVMDPGARRSLLLERLAAHWRAAPPQTPVIIAGSTGSVHATRALMDVVAGLPKGVVVLPGLDADLDDAVWAQIDAQHPQFALRRTLETLGVDRWAIAPLSPSKETNTGAARRVLIREALAPAQATADWLTRIEAVGGERVLSLGAEGLTRIEAATEDEEAAAIALALREALETEGQTAALVTPDAGLARRVAAKLGRWGIAPQMSQGVRLNETPAGLLLLNLAGLAANGPDPVLIAAALKHPLSPAERAGVARVEHAVLRGPARFASWRAMIDAAGEDAAPLVALHDDLSALIACIEVGPCGFDAFATALTQSVEAFSRGAIWRGDDGAAAANVLRAALAHGDAAGHASAPALLRMLDGLLRETETPPPRGGDPRIAIWGPLEARLQRRDLMILGGLNEGAWPSLGAEDPFLSRGMRARLGLPALEERIGLAAHDFAQLANAPRVLITRSLRKDGAPSTASRWLWRLETLLRAASADSAALRPPADHDAIAWARSIDAPAVVTPAPPPEPRPPAHARLKAINVTGVGQLIRDPYAIYARRILNLRVLKPIGSEPGAAERGDAIHKALERFGDGEDADALLALLEEEFRRVGLGAAARAADQARLQDAARDFVVWRNQRTHDGWRSYLEKAGALDLACGVRLTARADRIDISAEGGGVILDFKSGRPSTRKQVESGLDPQLPLEAAMLVRGAFADTPAARATALTYWRFGGAEAGASDVAAGDAAYALGEDALARTEGLLSAYADPERPFLCKPRVLQLTLYDDYDHLARRKEWANAEGEE
ncbi:MAG: double-strand break repair protein AddB [Alphaproteobacteria bacterium]|nr:double-strand break repair protein AddB [Alphaproteobacteria bacterium]